MNFPLTLGLILLTCLNLNGMDPDVLSSFDLESLRKYEMEGNETLMRVVFPEEAFSNTDKAMQNNLESFAMLFEKQLIISYNELYKIVFLDMRKNKTNQLQNSWLEQHKTLHSHIVIHAISPALKEQSTKKDLGTINDKNSQLRCMMRKYINYFFVPLQGLSDNDGMSPFDSRHYSSDSKCPKWLRNHLIKAISLDREMVFLNLYVKLQHLTTQMSEAMNTEAIDNTVSIYLHNNNYQHSIHEMANKILEIHNIKQALDEYHQLKDDICATILSIISPEEKYNIKYVDKLYIIDPIYDARIWKDNSILFKLNKPRKKRRYYINHELLTKIMNMLIKNASS